MATLYWVGGTGNWSDPTNHWATTSGGLPGVGNTPTSSDDVIFDTLSKATAYTATVNTTAVCKSFTLGAPLAGKVTWAGTSALTISGNINLSGGTAGITRTYTGTLTFDAAANLTFNGVTMNSATVFSGTGVTYQNQDNWNNSAKRITLTSGTWDINGKTITASDVLSNNSNTRSVIFGASTVNLSLAGTAWSFGTSTGLTITADTGQVNITGAGGIFNGGTKTYYGLTYSGGGANAMGQANTFTNLTITPPASVQNSMTFNASETITGTLNISGASQTQRVFVKSGTFTTQRTLTAANVTIANVDFLDMIGAGAGDWTVGTSIGNALNNSGITFTGAVTRYWVGNAGSWSNTAHWSTSSGGSTGATMPLPQDTVIFDSSSITSGSQTVTADAQLMGKSVSFSALGANLPTFALGAENWIFDSLTLKTGMTMTGAITFYFTNRSLASTFTTAGVSIPAFVNIQCVGGSVTMQDDSTFTTGLQVNFGTFDAGNKNLTIASFNMDNANTRTVNMGTGTWTMTGTGLIFTAANATNLTLNPSTSTIKFTDASASTKTFNTGGKTYANLWFTGAGTGALIFQGSPTFTNFKIDTQPKTVNFTNGITVTIASFTATGTAGNLITLAPVFGGFTLSSSSAYITGDYLSITGSTATGGATFYAGSHSTNGGSNVNWQFVDPPALIKRNYSIIM